MDHEFRFVTHSLPHPAHSQRTMADAWRSLSAMTGSLLESPSTTNHVFKAFWGRVIERVPRSVAMFFVAHRVKFYIRHTSDVSAAELRTTMLLLHKLMEPDLTGARERPCIRLIRTRGN